MSGQGAHAVRWVREVVSPRDPAFGPAVQLYESTFPEEERIPSDRLAALMERRAGGEEPIEGLSRLLVVQEEGWFLGFALCGGLFDLEADPAVLLGALYYMAVAPERRSSGIGGALYRSVRATLSCDAVRRGGALEGLLFEVERPELAPSAAERRLRERRTAFYEREGARLLEADYVQPPLGEGMAPLPMRLMAHGAAGWTDGRLCAAFYRLVYGLPAGGGLGETGSPGP